MEVVRFEVAKRYEPEKDWKRVSLCGQEEVSIEYFVKPPGHSSPTHDHPNAQVLYVLQGKLSITGPSGEKELLEAGDCVFIPGGETHIVTNELSTPSSGLDIFVPGRDFDFWKKRGLSGGKSQ